MQGSKKSQNLQLENSCKDEQILSGQSTADQSLLGDVALVGRQVIDGGPHVK